MNVIKKYSIFILGFFMLFSPAINFGGVVIKTVYIFLVIPAILGVYKYKKKERRNLTANFIVLALITSLIYSILMYVILAGEDFNWIKYNVIGILIFFSSYFLVKKYQLIFKNEFQIKILETIYWSVVLHSIIVIFVALNSTFRDLLYIIISQTDLSRSLTFREDDMTRFSGLVQGGFGSLSLYHSVGLIIGLHLYKNEKTSSINGNKILFGSLIIMGSMIFIGRLGVITTIIGVIALIFQGRLTSGDSKNYYNLVSATVIIMLSVIIYVLNNSDLYKIKWAFEIFIKIIENNELDDSTLALFSGVVPQLTTAQLMFGTGNYDYEYSDIGFIKIINGAGVIGAVISYFFLFSIVFYSKSKNKILNNKVYSILKIITLLIIISNIKNLYFFAYNDIFQIYFLVILSECVKENKLEKKWR